MVYLFDKSKTVYDGPFASRSLSDCVNYIGECAGEVLFSCKMKQNLLYKPLCVVLKDSV